MSSSSSPQSSRSTIFGSCPSSPRNSGSTSLRSTNFGSCLSTNESFHTAQDSKFSSCSTLYFSVKNQDGSDSNTLNWTMNYNDFDELSDTSTLVGSDQNDPQDPELENL
jgi:hypothetical protein